MATCLVTWSVMFLSHAAAVVWRCGTTQLIAARTLSHMAHRVYYAADDADVDAAGRLL